MPYVPASGGEPQERGELPGWAEECGGGNEGCMHEEDWVQGRDDGAMWVYASHGSFGGINMPMPRKILTPEEIKAKEEALRAKEAAKAEREKAKEAAKAEREKAKEEEARKKRIKWVLKHKLVVTEFEDRSHYTIIRPEWDVACGFIRCGDCKAVCPASEFEPVGETDEEILDPMEVPGLVKFPTEEEEEQ